MARLLRPGPRRVVRAAPSVLVVEGVAQGVEGLLPAGWRDVHAAARLQVALRGEDVHMHAAAALAVQDRRPRVAVRLQSGPRRLLELVEDGSDLLVGRLVVRRPRDHDRRVLALELERVGHGGHHVRIPAEDLDALAPVPLGVPFADEIVDRRPGEPLPLRRHLMCTAAVSVEAGDGEQRPLERHEVGNHRDGLGRRLVRVRPADFGWRESRQGIV